MNQTYILKDGEPVAEPDMVAWDQWMEQKEARILNQTTIGESRISTVFLGLDHSWNDGPPVLWETMVFGGALDQEMERYTSQAAALEGHAEMVRRVRATESEPEDTIKAFSDLLGRTLIEAKQVGSDEVHLTLSDGRKFRLYHQQDCCESVYVEDICGNLEDLIGEPLRLAEEATSNDRPSDLPPPEYADESQTWTFYKLATVKGYATIRFHGSSNGYYSESVDFEEVRD